jgi:peptidoglycan/xylan/chitin deacetylase (PgdA/CDA1 family)
MSGPVRTATVRRAVCVVLGMLSVGAALGVFAVARWRDAAFILVYHRVEAYQGGRRSLYVGPERFERQMRFLVSRGYRPVTLDRMREMLDAGRIEPKTFTVTFDDGYRNNRTYAYPVLRTLGIPATVFVTAGAIGATRAYPYMPPAPHLSAGDLAALAEVFTVGAHTVNHPNLSLSSAPVITVEIGESRRILEAVTGTPVRHFCYPFGAVFDGYAAALSAAGYRTACTTRPGFVRAGADPYALPRIEWKEPAAMSPRDVLKNLDFYVKILLGV